MQRYIALLFFVTSVTFFSYAQQKLVLTNTELKKEVVIEQNDVVKFLFLGYLGQIQEAYGKVELVTDSFVRFENNWNVRVKDIIGFRKFSRYRSILQPTVQIITIIGVIVAVPTIINNNPQLNGWQQLGVSFGLGTAGSLINKLLFPSRIKKFMADGWVAKVE
jgi:hypothetical protein